MPLVFEVPPAKPPVVPTVTVEPQRSEETLKALRRYRRERISVHPEIEIRGGNTSMQPSFGWNTSSLAFGTTITEPVTTTQTWGVYQGAQRLDVPMFLSEVGALDLRYQVQRDIQQATRRSRLWFSVAGLGMAGVVTGSLGAYHSPRWSQQEAQFTTLTLNSIGATVAGLFAGSFPSARAERLRRYPSASVGIREAEILADEHNERLRKELGLTAEDVWEIESRY